MYFFNAVICRVSHLLNARKVWTFSVCMCYYVYGSLHANTLSAKMITTCIFRCALMLDAQFGRERFVHKVIGSM